MRHELTFYQLGNADSCRIALADGRQLLFDYADMRNPSDPNDRRADLPRLLRDALGTRRAFDVVAFTHADNDHVCGAASFFYLEHSSKYQNDTRIRIQELWVPAAFIIESRNDLSADARAIQEEARYRLIQGRGIRVFSRPDRLADWLAKHNLSLAARKQLIVDAGQLVPGFTRAQQGVEFFVHSPFAHRLDNGKVIDRNDCSLVLQATFETGGDPVRLILAADTTHEILSELIGITRAHRNDERLRWHVIKLPHHCSYKSLSEEKGSYETTPDEPIAWLFEKQGETHGIIVSTSDPIPTEDTDQPPHVQAARYYRRIAGKRSYRFIVTMEHPSTSSPEPLVITIDHTGATPQQRNRGSSVIVTGRPAPRAG
ncbi:MAG: hypothetical protein OHK0022_08760 [Roseiflexaceae bacterium]